jgi:molecular chaperone GrpE
MSDEPELRADEPPPALVMPEPLEEVTPDVTLVVPAEPYQSIATDAAVPPPAELPPPPPDLTPVLAAVAALDRRLDGLQSQFEREVRAEATREKVVDRLHAELQEYKQDLLLGVLRPVFVDLIQLHDDIGKIVAAQAEPSEESARLLDLMGGFQQGIEDILYRQGVEPFTHDDDAFDPRQQRAFSTVPTDDPGQVKRVAVRVRRGFRAGDKVIRPEIVSVYALRR